jgi:hypothetical protein
MGAAVTRWLAWAPRRLAQKFLGDSALNLASLLAWECAGADGRFQ